MADTAPSGAALSGTAAPRPPVRVVRYPSGVVELLLDAPERGNALDLVSAESLAEAAHAVAADPGRAVLLRASGRNFCVGGDLRAFAGLGEQTGAYVRAVANAAHAAVDRNHLVHRLRWEVRWRRTV